MPGSAVSELAGRVLAGRYLLHGAIGTGASGRVYVADDTRLRRRVAVKVLHAALAEDAAFLRRFRAEAQLAASLHHPHIVTVFDWGEEDVPFMVLELLEGGSLRGMLDQGAKLSVAQAARVGRDVASALEYAHARGVLHRDIKPANLLFDEHGIVRVADFGLARALAEASWTEPSGAVFGTARYASPEQAVGVQLDGRSDLYSLAVVLVEAVTARVPFTSDTTLGMLTARTQRPLRAPDELGPLASVIDRAGAIEPAERYPDAATMRHALADAADELPPPGPLPLAGMVDRPDPHPTRAVTERVPASLLFDQDATEAVPARVPDVEGERGPVRAERRLVPFVVAVVLLVTVALAAAALARVGAGPPVQVPGLVGRTEQDAVALAFRSRLRATVVSRRQSPDLPGVVIDQDPESGTSTRGHTVRLVVSKGPPKIKVPRAVDRPWTEVQKELDAAGFAYKVDKRYDEGVPDGAVVSVLPSEGALVAPGIQLTIVVSQGHAPVKVPDVTRMSFDQARALLADAHVDAIEDDEFDNSFAFPAGQVVKTAPAAGNDAPYGSKVTVIVSKGPDLVTVPQLKGLTLDDASTALVTAGLQLRYVTGYKPGARVRSSNPNAGTPVLRGSSVDLEF